MQKPGTLKNTKAVKIIELSSSSQISKIFSLFMEVLYTQILARF